MGNQLISMNAICFKLLWYKIFVHSKLKLPNFLVDFVLSLDCHVHKFGIQSKRKTEKREKVAGQRNSTRKRATEI